MGYKVQLAYFRPTGKFLAFAEIHIEREGLPEIWEKIVELRRMGQLPGLRPNAGRDLFIVIDVPDHPARVPYLAMPPFVNEEDITPVRVSTGEMAPLVRLPLDDMPSPRTTTRDVVKVAIETDEEITPVDVPVPRKPDR